MGIQADMAKLSKSHSTTSNTVSKLLDKSRKLSVTMKEVSRPPLLVPVVLMSGRMQSYYLPFCRFARRWSGRRPR